MSLADLDLPAASRFGQIKALLAEDPESQARAYKLYPLVDPVCRDPEERAKFVADGVAWVSIRQDEHDRAWAERKTIDTFEHVATSCFRNEPESAFALLDAGRKLMPGSYRFDVVAARLLAAGGKLDQALAAAQSAREAGSVHAIALAANIRARIARETNTGYAPGMFDAALSMVSVDPQPDWPVIDLTAVLMTHARLLSERAVWEGADARRQTLEEAQALYSRLSKAPFIAVTREHALDMACHDAVELEGLTGGDRDSNHLHGSELCARAATEFGNLGGAAIRRIDVPSPPLDKTRRQAIVMARARIDRLEPRALVLVVGRGDESELVTWARPAAEVLRRIASRRPSVILVDRTDSPRASAVLGRILSLAGVEPQERIAAGHDTLAMPCLAALVAGRKKPLSCPLDEALVARLMKHRRFGVSVLVGRDLDAEIDDLRLYELPAVLLSYRQPLVERAKEIDVQLKNVSDAWLLSPRAESLEVGGNRRNLP